MLRGSVILRTYLFSLVVGIPSITMRAQHYVPPLIQEQEKFQIEKLSREGFELYYRSLGSGEPILILSGGPGDDCDYLLPAAEQIAKYAHVILLEQRGTGRSIPPHVDKNTISLALYLRDYEALRTHLGLQRWTVLGHSAGGVLAMNYAAAYPERVSKLILLDTVPVASQFLNSFQDNLLDRLSMEEREKFASTQKSDSPESQAALVRLQLEGLFYNRKTGEQLAVELSKAWHSDVGKLLGPEITASGYDLRPQLKNFDSPVLVLNGRQDPMDPLMAYETSAAFKHSTLTFIDRAGHFPWFEEPAKVDGAIHKFLDSRPSIH
jgi:proline iminopeptidase